MPIKVYLKPKNQLKRVDFTRLKITWDYHEEYNIELTTPTYVHTSQNIAVDIRVISNLFEKFGGIVRKREGSTENNLHNYTGYDYSSMLRGTFWKNFKNQTTKQICKWICKKAKMRTTSMFNASKKHKKLFFKGDTTRMNAIRQVCALDNSHIRPYVTHNKKLGLKYIKSYNSGYVIKVGDYVKADESLDLNDLTNHIIIYSKKGKVKKTYKNTKSIVEFGDLTKILNYPEKPKKTKKGNEGNYSADVQDVLDEAKKIWYEKSKPNYKTIVILPLTKQFAKLKVGFKLAFIFDGKSAMNKKKYWIQSKEVEVDENKQFITLTLLDRKPYLFDDWRYKDPDGKLVNRKQKKYSKYSNPKPVNRITSKSLVNKASNCSYCTKGLTKNKVSYENKCPACGTNKKLSQNSNTFVCGKCNVKFCAKCGSELRKPRRYILKRVAIPKKPAGVHSDVYNKAVSLWAYGPFEIFYFVRSFYYKFYGGDKKSDYQTFKSKSGNCYDMTQLLITMYKCVGVTGTMQQTTCPTKSHGVVPHVNMKIKLKGVTYILDPASPKPANRHKAKFKGR